MWHLYVVLQMCKTIQYILDLNFFPCKHLNDLLNKDINNNNDDFHVLHNLAVIQSNIFFSV